MEKKYNVTIKGIKEGSDITEVSKKFSTLFKIDEKKALNLLFNKTILKTKVDDTVAKKYENALHSIGVLCSIDEVHKETEVPVTQEIQIAPSKVKVLPQGQETIPVKQAKNKNVATAFAFFLGGLGVHKFYLGQNGVGFLYLLFFWTYIPAILGLLDALHLLILKEENFNEQYNKPSNTLEQPKPKSVISQKQGDVPKPIIPKPITVESGVSRCPYCAEEVQPTATLCPHCKQAIISKNPVVNGCLAIILFIIVFIILYSFISYKAEKDTDRLMDKIERDMRHFNP